MAKRDAIHRDLRSPKYRPRVVNNKRARALERHMEDDMRHRPGICTCGSGKPRYDLTDARGIFCCYVCEDCEVEKAAGYRPDIFDDPNYDCDEQIEEDY